MSVQVSAIQKAGLKGPKAGAPVRETVGTKFDVRKFVETFELLAEAKGGVASLRRLILELAIRGHFSAGLPGDDSAQTLLNAAHADRVERQRRGDARQMDHLPNVSAEDAPFGLPVSWVWTRIGLAMNLVNGRAFKPTDWATSGLPIIRIQNLNNPEAPFNYCAFQVEPKHLLHDGDFLISWSGTPGTSFGAFIWKGPKGVLNQHIFRAEIYGETYDLGFLRIAINARIDEMIAQAHGGVGLQHITKGKLEALTIPLPPLAEQECIVARVDQLMALIDDLEARQTKKRELSARFTTASLEALTTADGPEEFDAAWKRVVGNFATLVDRAEKAGRLRVLLRRLALRGYLTANPFEKREKDGPWRVPATWHWRRAEEICEFITKGTTPASAKMTEGSGEVPFLKVYNLTFGGSIDFTVKPTFVASSVHLGELERSCVLPGDVLMNIVGPPLGKVSIVPADHGQWNINQAIARFRPKTCIYGPFLALCLLDVGALMSFGTADVRGTAGQDNISLAQCRDLSIPVPSLDEQHLAVSRLQTLMKLCDELEAKLCRAEDRASKLVAAVVQELMG